MGDRAAPKPTARRGLPSWTRRPAPPTCAAAGATRNAMRAALLGAAAMVQDDPAATIPLTDGLGRIDFPITTANPMAQRYFNQGLGYRLWLQPCRRDRLVPRRATARSRMRDVLVGRGAGPRPQYQCPVDARRQQARAARRSPARSDLSATVTPPERALIIALSKALFRPARRGPRDPRRCLCRRHADRGTLLPRARRHRPARGGSGDGHAAVGLLGARQARPRSRASAKRSRSSSASWRAMPPIRRRRTSTSI